MGRHRSRGDDARRGIAWWPLAALAAVVLVVLGYVGWTWLGGLLDRRAAAEARNCVEGEITLTVAVAPSAAEPLRAVAATWSAERPVVQDRCVAVRVSEIDPRAVLTGLTGGWDESRLGPRPAAWVPDSSLWVHRLAARDPALLGSQPESLASSPVVLAMPAVGALALRSGAPRWGELPDLMAAADGWNRYGHPEWGRFSVALPDPSDNPATALALHAALAGAGQPGTGPVTSEVLGQEATRERLGRLAAARPPAPGTARDVLVALTGRKDLAGADVDAVPVTEVDLYRRNLGQDGGPKMDEPLIAVPAGGPTPVADFPIVALTGQGQRTDAVLVRAAQRFGEFVRGAERQEVLARAGLRVPTTGVHPDFSPGLRWEPLGERVAQPEPGVSQQLAAAWANTAGAQTVTFLVDVSRSVEQDGGDGRSRLEWLRAVLRGQVDRSPASAFGLWEFSRSVDGDRPYRQLVPTGPTRQQRDALLAGVDQLRPFGDTHLHPSLVAAYRDAVERFRQGQPNRLVVVTDGSDNSGMSVAQLRDELGKARRQDRPVSVNVVAFGPDVDRGRLDELARATGGTVSVAVDGKGLDAAISQVLSSAD
ncbi:von Willebrand factor type A domain-containing protein [Streptoalloteichus tenebrarius]|uniref:von Willebrand factor type A domain-containing protein n=1 Tax=Streptoalloteichus tenebrarius (strain ATCC 17920 / DSM 40477 / JCM 4838 / CBS 697.72 / NBRC 16177 / NCIMB 11028 / NRRL B-12390 / A12253. 1 / ISP 5477) TaxID=1933 RepID=A0ABT1HQR7_STRSD|nr:substrate-binding domain-containing protein [Streptoalloteichus tenebrarius]MCP2257862.1 von Willebrand factor type A domain-containing protein [Streptoalloteichus tenebrarius]BFE99776.1 substrate-binding domain-containing protein [Streptoalloteichus tenebrarius]